MTSLRATTNHQSPDSRVEDIFRLTPTQEGMLFHSLLESDRDAHHSRMICDLEGPLDVEAFKGAFQDLSDATPALRTAFRWAGLNHPVQVVFDSMPVLFRYIDLSDSPAHETEALASAAIAEDGRAGFVLDTPPLSRITLIRLTGERFRVLWAHVDLLFDGWSLALLLKELFARYDSRIAHRPRPRRAQQRPSFKTFVAEAMRDESPQSRAFWARELSGFESPTPLPFAERTRDSNAGFEYATLLLGQSLSEQITSAAKRLRISPNTVFQAAWGLLLCRYGGREDVVFGTVVSGRGAPLADIESMVGVLINTIPVRVRTAPHLMLGSWMQELHRAAVYRAPHEGLSLSRIQDAGAWPSGRPLFESVLIFENYPGSGPTPDFGGVRITNLRNFERVPYPLTLFVMPGDQISIETSFDTSRLRREDVERMLDVLAELLTEMLASLDHPLANTLAFLPQRDRDAIQAANETYQPYPLHGGLHEMFIGQAALTPDRLALIDGEWQLTYEDLSARVDRLASRLIEQGVTTEQRVGVFLDRSAHLVISLLAVIRAGGAFVPLEPDLPSDRLRWMCVNAGVSVIVTAADLHERARALAHGSVALVRADLDGGPSTPLSEFPSLSEDNVAYVIYTSGSTGRPKGVMVSHASIRNRIIWMQDAFRLTEADAVAQKTPFGFDVSVWEFFWPLSYGARLVIVPPGAHRDPAALAAAVSNHHVSVIHFVPSMLRVFIDSGAFRRCASLRLVFSSGEELPASLVRDHHAVSSAELHNLYGPTEAAVDVTWWPALAVDETARVPIGKPIANTQIHLLDAHLSPVPMGGIGEICIGGVNVARGYIGNPGLTAAQFAPDAFAEGVGSRLYRTGDLGRYLPDGAIEYLGRRDDQVKIRGVRIELGEVENALRAQPGVLDAAATLVRRGSDDQHIVAFVRPAAQFDASEIRRDLRQYLLESMIPTRVLTVHEIPVGRTGKIDRKALAALAESDQSEPVPRPQLTTGIVSTVLRICEQILGVQDVRLESDFFELGGHSLSVIRLCNRLKSETGVELTLREIFELRTIAEIARLVDERQAEVTTAPGRPRDEEITQRSPAASAQSALWFLHRLNPFDTAAALAASVRVQGLLDLAALERAVRLVSSRHEMLRTTFFEENGQVFQRIADDIQPDFAVMDGSGDNLDVEALVDLAVARPFDLAVGPLWRVRVVRVHDGEHRIITATHHIVSDGWSMGILVQDLVECYNASVTGRQIAPPPRGRYSVWSRTENARRSDVSVVKQVEASTQALSTVDDRLDLPQRNAAADHSEAHTLTTLLTPHLAARLRDLALTQHTTPFVVGLASWSATLHQLTQQTSIPVGTPVANRSDEQYHDVIGYFVNLLVIPTHVRPDQSFASLVDDLNGTVLDALDRADAPFDLVVARLNPPRRAGRTPLVRVAFAYEYIPSGFDSPTGLRVLTPYRDAFPSVGASRFDMFLTLLDDGVTISAHLEYDRALYEDTTASHVFSMYQRFLAAALDTPTLRVDAESEAVDSSNGSDPAPQGFPDFRFDLKDER